MRTASYRPARFELDVAIDERKIHGIGGNVDDRNAEPAECHDRAAAFLLEL